MKVLFLTSGRRLPSTRFRILAYLPSLRSAGIACTVRHSHPPKYQHYPWLGWRGSERARRTGRRLNLLEARARRFDLAVIERELFDSDSVDFEAEFRRIVPRMLLDVDDAVFLRHPAKFEQLAALCDGVIAGNQAIADHARSLNQSVTVIPTSVDVSRYPRPSAPRPSSPVVIGWTGTSSNLPYLKLLEAPLRRLAERFEIRLQVIADAPGPLATMDFGRLPVEFTRWSLRREMNQLQPFQIGIMPLADSEWERYKCGLKLLQYMALSIPAVASPVGVNPQIVRSGENGLLADSEAEWEQALADLISDAVLRERLGAAGRRTVETDYSIAANAPRLQEFLKSLAAS